MTSVQPSAIKNRYRNGEDRPLGSFVGLMSVYAGLLAGGSAVIKWRGTRLPDRIPMADLAMGAVATHKVARLLAKDPVTSPLRAPFTRFKGQSGEAEVAEEVVGSGPQHAIGELLTCPFCLDQWVASAFLFGYLVQPRATRLLAGMFTMVAGADVLQFGYDAMQPDS